MKSFFVALKRSLVAVLILFVLNLFLPFSSFAELGTKARTGSAPAVSGQTAGNPAAKRLKAGAAKKARQKAFTRAKSSKKASKVKKSKALRTMKKAEIKTHFHKTAVASSSTSISKRSYHVASNSHVNKHCNVYNKADRAKHGWWAQYR